MTGGPRGPAPMRFRHRPGGHPPRGHPLGAVPWFFMAALRAKADRAGCPRDGRPPRDEAEKRGIQARIGTAGGSGLEGCPWEAGRRRLRPSRAGASEPGAADAEPGTQRQRDLEEALGAWTLMYSACAISRAGRIRPCGGPRHCGSAPGGRDPGAGGACRRGACIGPGCGAPCCRRAAGGCAPLCR